MPRKGIELHPIDVRRRTGVDGFHAVGGVPGLHLLVRGRQASWILRTMIGTRRRDVGLGGFPEISLAAARENARKIRADIRAGIDPIEARRAARHALCGRVSFDEAAKRLIEAKGTEWRNAKHRAQWKTTLDTYASPIIGDLSVDTIDVDHVLRVLAPIWTEKNETANRVRQRIEAVLDWARAAKLRTGDNPARWRGHLDKLLAKPSKVKRVKHHRALPYASLPTFISELRAQGGIAARAVELLILTATRSGEVRLARWKEFDLDAATWTIPADRMKAGREHRVPLSAPALALLDSLPRVEGCEFAFPSPTGKAFSDMALAAVLRRMEVDAVPHGFRSTFRDWVGEETHYPSDVAEAALAHTIKSATQAAYQRGDLFDKRTHLMTDWALYATGATPARVASIRAVA